MYRYKANSTSPNIFIYLACVVLCAISIVLLIVLSLADLNYECGGKIEWPDQFIVRNETGWLKKHSVIEDPTQGVKLGTVERSAYFVSDFQVIDNENGQVFKSEKEFRVKTVHNFYNCSDLVYTIEKVQFNFDLNNNKFEIKDADGNVVAISEKTRDSSFNLVVHAPSNENVYYAVMFKENKSRFNVQIFPSNPIETSVYALIVHHIFNAT